MTILPRSVTALALTMASVAATLAGCAPIEVHFFGGYAYDAERDCLEKSATVDVVEGPDPTAAACEKLHPADKEHPRCWLSPAGTAIVTDRGCDAPPDYEDRTSDAEGVCVKALAAHARKGHAECPAAADAGAK